MSRSKVDYDRLAGGYDQRFEHDPSTGVSQALHQLIDTNKAKRILEVGCGTGHWLAEISEQAESAYGVDLSSGMLSQAKQRNLPTVLIQANGLDLPFGDGSFDLIFCVNAIHHFGDPAGYIHGTTRLLKPEGVLAVIGGDPHQPDHVWYVHDYFEGVRHTDLERFPTQKQIQHWMYDAGLTAIHSLSVQHIQEEKPGQAVFDDPFLAKEATSQLALLSDKAYQAGLNRIRSDVEKAEAASEELVFRTDLRIYMHWGRMADR